MDAHDPLPWLEQYLTNLAALGAAFCVFVAAYRRLLRQYRENGLDSGPEVVPAQQLEVEAAPADGPEQPNAVPGPDEVPAAPLAPHVVDGRVPRDK